MPHPTTPNTLTLDPVRVEDFPVVADLAQTIWRAHYVSIIGIEQINYMLDGRFTPDNLRRYVDADDRWMQVLHVCDEPVGYCSYALTATPAEMKLEQLYVLPHQHGRGLGRFMLERIEAHAKHLQCKTLMLQVNKHNERSIRVYLRSGFAIREAKVFDIGKGYVMDDYVMIKPLP